ncbi:MAG: prolipoprotein diacylglyceryl transferase [Puniceicoccaceae bacterium]
MPPTSSEYWVHDLSPFLIQFPESWPIAGVSWYGLSYISGFAIAWWLLRNYAARGLTPLNQDQRSGLLTAVIIGVIVGGRLGYMLLYARGNFLADPLLILRVWEGGMASHGGFIGVAVATIWYARSQGLHPLHLGDCLVSAAPAGLLLGRLANFINGELWGTPSTVSWAVIFPRSTPVFDPETGFASLVPRHPSQLYQAGLEGLFLLIWCQLRVRSGIFAFPGRLVGEFLALYGVLRIGVEFFREPDVGIEPILGMSRGQFYSLFVVAIGLALLLYTHLRKQGSHPDPKPVRKGS